VIITDPNYPPLKQKR